MAAREIIKRNFSKCAPYYDRYSAVQNRLALGLIDRIKTGTIKSVLDIGCGTGNYTGLLRRKLPGARIVAVDISPGMIEIAKKKLKDENIEFVVADAERISFEKKFDLISSNSSLHWFENLGQTLSKYKELLNKKGFVLFSTFGPLTFFELNRALSRLYGRRVAISSHGFAGKREIEGMLEGLFGRFEVGRFIYKEKYASLPELLKSIKYTGVRGDSEAKGFWTPRMMNNIERLYREKFKDIVATYEVLISRGAG